MLQFLPEHQKLTERVRKRLYYGLDPDVCLDGLSCPVTGKLISRLKTKYAQLITHYILLNHIYNFVVC